MWFDVNAAKARIEAEFAEQPKTGSEPAPHAIRAIHAIPEAETGRQIAQIARIARPPASGPKNDDQPAPSVSRQDDPPLNADGYARTWTGRVVSLANWRALSDWDRHGPNGRLHCGICRQWVERDTPCRENGCWKGEQHEN